MTETKQKVATQVVQEESVAPIEEWRVVNQEFLAFIHTCADILRSNRLTVKLPEFGEESKEVVEPILSIEYRKYVTELMISAMTGAHEHMIGKKLLTRLK